MIARYFKPIFLLIVLSTAVCAEESDDNWDLSNSTGDVPSVGEKLNSELLPKDKVLKWCNESGKLVRYSTQFIPTLRLCGEVQAVKTCDPSGRRFFAPDTASKAPYAFRDCSLGDRLIVERLDPPLPSSSIAGLPQSSAPKENPLVGQMKALPFVKDFQNFSTDALNQPLTDEERLQAHHQLEELERGRTGDLANELQLLLRDMTSAVRTLRNGVGGHGDAP